MDNEYDSNAKTGSTSLAVGLGWFSIGLGMAELLAPRAVARAIGMPNASDATLRAFGAREVANGVAILAQPDRAAWLWSRVCGDTLDLSYLASGFTEENANPARIGMAMAAVLGVTALDVICAQDLSGDSTDESKPRVATRGAVRIERTITVNKPIDQVYQFWRQFENFPRFMDHLESVEKIDARRSRWRAKAPGGRTVQWDAELLEDRDEEWIAWRSLEGSQIRNSGSVRFEPAPGARGTEVRVQLQYSPPAGALGRSIAWLFGEEPDQQIQDDLRRFKQLMETGEVTRSDGPALWRPAQPAGDSQRARDFEGVRR